MSNYGITVTKEGINFPARGKDLIYTSQRDTLKYLPKYSGLLEYTDGSTVEIDHNLGYTPGFLTWRTYGFGWYVHQDVDTLSIDSNKLYVPGLSAGEKVYYIIMVNPVVGGALPVKIGNGTGMKATTRSINVASMNAFDLSFYSEYAHLYTVKELSFSGDVLASTGQSTNQGFNWLHTNGASVSVPHGLSYTPGFIAYFNIEGGGNMMNPYSAVSIIDGSTTDISVRVSNYSVTYTYSFFYETGLPEYTFEDIDIDVTVKLLGVKLE